MAIPSGEKIAKMTPMLRQYYELKSQVPDCILLFRMGDFYEIFGDDAEEIAPVLQLVLTSRERGDQNRIPFCGVPHHSARGYWLKLLKKGYKIAIGDQVEDPKTAKGLVRREVTRIITPGSMDDLEGLTEESPNYLLAAYEDPKSRQWAAVLADVSTGEMKAANLPNIQEVFSHIERHKVKEVLVRDFHQQLFTEELSRRHELEGTLVEPLPEAPLRDKVEQKNILERIFGTADLQSMPCKAIVAGEGIIAALCIRLENLGLSTRQFMAVKPLLDTTTMNLDEIAIRDLELFVTVRRGNTEGSLFKEINRTMSPMGARLLRDWLISPLTCHKSIRSRQAAITALIKSSQANIVDIRRVFGKTPDLIRLATRVHNLTAAPIEVAAIRDTLRKARSLQTELNNKKLIAAPYDQIAKQLNQAIEPLALLERALNETPTVLGKGKNVFLDGYDPQLAELNDFAASGSQKVAEYEAKLKSKYEITSLKIKTHKTFGLLIEVTKSNLHKVPEEFIRRQTMVNCERFVTDELKELSDALLTAEERAVALERKIYGELLDRLSHFRVELSESAAAIALLDALQSLAWKAIESDWCLPTTLDSQKDQQAAIKIIASRHPVVEAFVGKHKFVPNDIHFAKNQRHLLITGPNMAGKSTVMRQTALTAILHQMGSYVPAQEAELPVFDRVFTRVGASDDLSRGQSTFMVEMTEAANVLRQASARSLVILDEVGRGTSTEDGLALAAAILEDLSGRVGCYSMFATHYHELAHIATSLSDVCPMQTMVKETKAGVEFTHQLCQGAADSSFGIEVAKLAGVPAQVIERAQYWLAKHKKSECELNRINGATSTESAQNSYRPVGPPAAPLEELFAMEAAPNEPNPELIKLSNQITALKINRLTPLQALNILNEIQESLIKPQFSPLFGEDLHQ